MRRSLALTLPLALALTACAPGNPGLVVLNVVAPSDACVYDTQNAQYFQGAWDLSLDPSPGYGAAFRVGNQLLSLSSTGNFGPPMSDPNLVFVQTLEVELRDQTGAPIAFGGLPNPYTVASGGGAIAAGDGMSGGEGLVAATVIPGVYAAELRGFAGSTIVASIRALGTTLGDAAVLSNEFDFPVALCMGCLLPGCLMDSSGDPICTPSCTPGQDGVHISCDASCVAGG